MNLKKATNKTKEFLILLSDLFIRWMDENQYEDINDYLKAIQKVEPRAKEMTEHPFGVKVEIENKLVHFFVDIIGNQIVIGTHE